MDERHFLEMSGKFNPFQSKQEEVLRTHVVPDEGKARKLLAKLQRKRPCVWVEIRDFEDATAGQILNGLDGAASLVLFLRGAPPAPASEPLPPVLDALIARLWKNFNKLHLVRMGESDPESPPSEEGA